MSSGKKKITSFFFPFLDQLMAFYILVVVCKTDTVCSIWSTGTNPRSLLPIPISPHSPFTRRSPPAYACFNLFIYFEKVARARKSEKWREISPTHRFTPSIEGHNDQCLARPKLRVRSSIHFSCVGGRNTELGPSSTFTDTLAGSWIRRAAATHSARAEYVLI